jgi:hypothetical protein
MSDQYGQRQIRNGIVGPTAPPQPVLSEDALVSIAATREHQAAAAAKILKGASPSDFGSDAP